MAQLVERFVRNEQVRSSSLLSSTSRKGRVREIWRGLFLFDGYEAQGNVAGEGGDGHEQALPR